MHGTNNSSAFKFKPSQNRNIMDKGILKIDVININVTKIKNFLFWAVIYSNVGKIDRSEYGSSDSSSTPVLPQTNATQDGTELLMSYPRLKASQDAITSPSPSSYTMLH